VPRTDLTKRQQEIFDFIVEYWASHGYGPNTKDVQRKFEFASYTSAQNHLMALANKGYVEMVPGSIYPAGLKIAIQQTVSQLVSHETSVTNTPH
jgi:SOS-response transcriptional repressor LexA